MPKIYPLNIASPKANLFLASAILLAWIVTVVFLFWHFHFRYYTTWISFNGSALQQDNLVLESGKLSVVHFIDETCPCTRFSLPHIKKVEAKFGTETVAYKKVIRGSGANWLSGASPASPAVAVWSDTGKLIYFGPYSSGIVCGEGKDLLSKVLSAPKSNGQWTHQDTVGCFCQWQNKTI